MNDKLKVDELCLMVDLLSHKTLSCHLSNFEQ